MAKRRRGHHRKDPPQHGAASRQETGSQQITRQPVRKRLVKILVSCFAMLNLCAVLLANGQVVAARVRRAAQRDLAPSVAYRVLQLDWLVRTYAFFAGLDNYWTLFSTLPRFNYWYVIKAHYADGSDRVLPLPLQSERTFLQRHFFDFRTAKYYHNIYLSDGARANYARYLCTHFPRSGSAAVDSVTIELHHQMILDREEARARGTPVAPQSYQRVYTQVSCAGP